jgi:hypothetical protein
MAESKDCGLQGMDCGLEWRGTYGYNVACGAATKLPMVPRN